ncbi:hypothetical protein DAEQUDRAFT_723763 [Daedalea quercina L-15889]|uniref:Uncharacterized protein n=1 Tax=Daedalea quercina L-15889 TaxID=1314783 RepID=A0A165S992_9APHY|nr:hypothetical protein DAEQUDRAFT_723763 [Daedalea quercina L-15889]
MALPPPYFDATHQTTEHLTSSFESLLNAQNEIQTHFGTVAERLATIPKIGPHHPLTEEWNTLRQLHKEIHRNSQTQAGRCAAFLSHFSEVIVPLSQSQKSSCDRQLLARRFVEKIDEYKRDAEQCSRQFDNLKMRIEGFRHKCGRQAKGSKGFWSKVKECCAAIGRAIGVLLNHFITMLRKILSALQSMHMSLGPLSLDVYFNEYSRLPEEHEMTRRGFAKNIDSTARELESKLGGFEFAWDVVRKSCDLLQTQLALADTVTESPVYFRVGAPLDLLYL